MDERIVQRAVAAVELAAARMDLVSHHVSVIQNSTKVSLRLLPCDVFARVAPIAQAGQLALEIELAQQFAAAGAPAVALDPRIEPQVYELDGFAVTWWTYHDTTLRGSLPPSQYADALERIHGAMRSIDVETPHFLDRIAEAEDLVTNPNLTPALNHVERKLLAETFADVRATIGRSRPVEQLLHGEPHPGNVLNTAIGPLFIDLETACRGPIEFDLAHVPRDVSENYSGLDQALLDECRRLVLAMVAAWRWDVSDEFPNGLHHGRTIIDLLRQGPPWTTIGELSSR